MSSLEIHQCRSCGGNLLIDPAKQIYVCTYCGITYDYEYFKEEDVHEKAYRFLEKREFTAANDAFTFALTKDPSDFLSLRGKMLAIGKLPHIAGIKRISGDDDFGFIKSNAEDIVSACKEDHKKYFESFFTIYENAQKLKELRSEHRRNQRRMREIDGKIQRLEDQLNTTVIDIGGLFKLKPKTAFIVFLAAAIALPLIGILIYNLVDPSYRNDSIAIVTFFLCFIGVIFWTFSLIWVFSKYRDSKEIKIQIAEASEQEIKISDIDRPIAGEIEKLMNESSELAVQVLEMDKELLKDVKSRE